MVADEWCCAYVAENNNLKMLKLLRNEIFRGIRLRAPAVRLFIVMSFRVAVLCQIKCQNGKKERESLRIRSVARRSPRVQPCIASAPDASVLKRDTVEQRHTSPRARTRHYTRASFPSSSSLFSR